MTAWDQSNLNMIKSSIILTFLTAAALIICVPVLQGASPAPSADSADTKVDATIRKEVLDKLATELDARYAIPETAKKLAAVVRTKQKAKAYKDITSALELARVVNDDLFAVAHDKHLHINFSFAPLPAGAPSMAPSPEELERARKKNGDISKLEILDGNVGYMRVNGMPFVEVARPAIAAAFAFLHNTDALIIDTRGNFGGDPRTVALYVSYLSEGEPFIANSFHYRASNRVEEFKTTEVGDLSYGVHKPVFVLTSTATFSGGEELAYDLQALKRALIVGELTAGGGNPSERVPLGHDFVLSVPIARGVNPITKTSWEGVGVRPDVSVESSTALSKAHSLAIERLRTLASDEGSRSEFDSVAMKLQAIEEVASGTAARLKNADLIGVYVPEVGSGTTFVISEKDGRLLRHVDGFPDRSLIYLGGNRYRLEGLASDFAISFRMQSGKTELLYEESRGPSVIRFKQ